MRTHSIHIEANRGNYDFLLAAPLVASALRFLRGKQQSSGSYQRAIKLCLAEFVTRISLYLEGTFGIQTQLMVCLHRANAMRTMLAQE